MGRVAAAKGLVGAWVGVALLGVVAGLGQVQADRQAEKQDSGLPIVELKPQEVNLWEHKVGPDAAIHLTAAEYQEESTKSRFFVGQSHVEFEIVVSDNGRVDSAKLVGDAHGKEDQARIIEMAREFKPWTRDGVPVRVKVRDYVSILPPERWSGVHMPFPEQWDSSTTSVGLKRTTCFGSCPDYQVTVSGDGLIHFSGGMYVLIPGDHVAHISREAARQLVLDFRKADFLSALGTYRGNWTDNPTQTVTLTIAGKTKTVVDYVGTDAGLPLAIRNLEAEIDEVAGTARWVKGNEGALASLDAEKWPFAAATPQNVALYATAIETKNEPLIERYLAERGPIVSPDPSKRSPVCVASEMGDLDLVGRMTKPPATKDGEQAKVEIPTAVAQQCLWNAARSGNVDVLQYWLDRGANPKVQPTKVAQDYSSGLSILANALMSGRAEMVRRLLNYKLDVNVQVQDRPLLQFAMQRDGNKDEVEVVAMLIKAGADVNARDFMGETALFAANWYPEIIKPLVAAGADLEARDNNGSTVLVRYAFMEPMVRELLADGADPTATNKRGESAVTTAKQYGCPACVTLIEAALKQRLGNGAVPASAP